MRQLEAMPAIEFTDMPTLQIVDMSMFEDTEKPKVKDINRPIYQQLGFWILLAVCIVVSFASGILIRTGGSLFG